MTLLWLIILVAAIVGVHHFVKYLLPVLRVTRNEETWRAFKARGRQYHPSRKNHT